MSLFGINEFSETKIRTSQGKQKVESREEDRRKEEDRKQRRNLGTKMVAEPKKKGLDNISRPFIIMYKRIISLLFLLFS